MVFSNLFFIFVFLPVSLILYNISPVKLKNLVLTLISLVFFAWGTPKYILFILFSIFFNYFGGLEIEREKKSGGNGKMGVIFASTVNILLLSFFKYWGFLLSNINAVLGTNFADTGLAAPIGISFFTFQVLSYIFDVYRDKAPAQHNIIDFACFVSFFPKLMQGPITEYNQFYTQLKERKHLNVYTFGEGAKLFILGLGKKMLIADNLAVAYSGISSLSSLSTGSAWLGCIFYTLDILFDWTSYSDMALGLGKMFGFDVGINFDYPYLSLSVSEFWRRWHMSLNKWFTHYVYFPMGGNRCSKGKHIRNVMVVWLLTGIWHGSAWNFIFWGIFYGIVLLIEKYLLNDILEKLPKTIRHIYSMLIVMIGWVFFFSSSLSGAFKWIGKMFLIGASGVWDSSASYYLSTNLIILIIAVIGSTKLMQGVSDRLVKKGKTGAIIINLAYIFIIVASIACMIGSTNSTFLYAQF